MINKNGLTAHVGYHLSLRVQKWSSSEQDLCAGLGFPTSSEMSFVVLVGYDFLCSKPLNFPLSSSGFPRNWEAVVCVFSLISLVRGVGSWLVARKLQKREYSCP